VTLDGSGSTSSSEAPLRYHWTSLSGITLSDTTAVRPTFTSPSSVGAYRFVLVVSEGALASVMDEVVVRVLDRPLALAGADQAVANGTPVTLDGSGSISPYGSSLRYHWRSLSGITLSDTTAVRPTFGSPSSAGAYRFSLVVSDGTRQSLADEVVVTVTVVAPVPGRGDVYDGLAVDGGGAEE
jgi:chitodextrinase